MQLPIEAITTTITGIAAAATATTAITTTTTWRPQLKYVHGPGCIIASVFLFILASTHTHTYTLTEVVPDILA